MLLPRAAAAARARLAPRTALSTVTESAPWYKRPLSLSSSESGWQLAVATWGFIIFVGVPWSYNRMLALTAPDPATRVTRHKDTVQQMVYELRCASGFFCVFSSVFGSHTSERPALSTKPRVSRRTEAVELPAAKPVEGQSDR